MGEERTKYGKKMKKKISILVDDYLAYSSIFLGLFQCILTANVWRLISFTVHLDEGLMEYAPQAETSYIHGHAMKRLWNQRAREFTVTLKTSLIQSSRSPCNTIIRIAKSDYILA